MALPIVPKSFVRYLKNCSFSETEPDRKEPPMSPPNPTIRRGRKKGTPKTGGRRRHAEQGHGGGPGVGARRGRGFRGATRRLSTWPGRGASRRPC